MPENREGPVAKMLKGLRKAFGTVAKQSITDELEREEALEKVDLALADVEKALETPLEEEVAKEVCPNCGGNSKKCGCEKMRKNGPEDEDDDDKGVSALAKKYEEAQELLEKALSESAEAKDRVAKLEETLDAQARIAKASTLLGNIPGIGAEDFAGILKGLTPAQERSLGKVMKAANALIDQSGILKEIGKHGPAEEGSPQHKLEQAVKEVQKADPKLTKQQAIAKAYEDNPALYDEITTRK